MCGQLHAINSKAVHSEKSPLLKKNISWVVWGIWLRRSKKVLVKRYLTVIDTICFSFWLGRFWTARCWIWFSNNEYWTTILTTCLNEQRSTTHIFLIVFFYSYSFMNVYSTPLSLINKSIVDERSWSLIGHSWTFPRLFTIIPRPFT